jgi:hypothetical protein
MPSSLLSPTEPTMPNDASASPEDELPTWDYLGLRGLIRSDVQVWGEMLAFKRRDEPIPTHTAIRLVLVYPGLRAALLHRLAYATHRTRIPFVPLILANLNLSLHGFDIPSHIEVGPRFYVPHPVGTVVTARRIGAGASLAPSPSATAPRSARTRWC